MGKPIDVIDKRLNELEPALRAYFSYQQLRDKTDKLTVRKVDSREAPCSHLICNSSLVPEEPEGDCRFIRWTRAVHVVRHGPTLTTYLHVPIQSDEFDKWRMNHILIVDCGKTLYLLRMMQLSRLVQYLQANQPMTYVEIDGVEIYLNILNKYVTLDLEEIIEKVPNLLIDKIEVMDGYITSLHKTTTGGSKFIPFDRGEPFWQKVRLLPTKQRKTISCINLDTHEVIVAKGQEEASSLSGVSLASVKKVLNGTFKTSKDKSKTKWSFLYTPSMEAVA